MKKTEQLREIGRCGVRATWTLLSSVTLLRRSLINGLQVHKESETAFYIMCLFTWLDCPTVSYFSCLPIHVTHLNDSTIRDVRSPLSHVARIE